jgi:signal transduction histidine kinase
MPSDNVFFFKPGNYIRVVVEDNGVGIPEQNLNKIFDLYFTTKRSGAGFGLSICNSIITRHGGIITVDSKLNVGSKFTFFLPASPDAVRKTQEKNEKILLNGGRILVLEDEETVAHVLKYMLKRLNF